MLVPSEKADISKEHAAMLLQEFKWSKFSAVVVPAKPNGQMVVAIVNTGSAGVVISKSCFDWLRLINDNEVDFTITLATDTNKKVRKVMFGVKVTVGEKTVSSQLFYYKVCTSMYFLELVGCTRQRRVSRCQKIPGC